MMQIEPQYRNWRGNREYRRNRSHWVRTIRDTGSQLRRGLFDSRRRRRKCTQPRDLAMWIEIIAAGAWFLLCMDLSSSPQSVSALVIPIFSIRKTGTDTAKIQEAIALSKKISRNITAAFEAVHVWKSILDDAEAHEILDYPVKHLSKRLYASCCVRIGQDEDAARIYRSALKDCGDDPKENEYRDLKIGLGRCYLRLLRYREAFEEFCDAGGCREAAICGLRIGDVALARSVLQINTINGMSSPSNSNLLHQVLSVLYSNDTSPITAFLAGKVINFEQYIFRNFCEANNAGFDDPLLLHLDDKVLLHTLLSRSWQTATFWPRGAIVQELSDIEDETHSVLCILKKRAGYGSHGNSIVHADLEAAVQCTNTLKAEGGEQILLQEMIQQPLLIWDRKFSIRVFVVRVGIHCSYLYLEGLVKLAWTKWSSNTTSMSQQMTNSGRSDRMDQLALSSLHEQLGELRYSHIWSGITRAARCTLTCFDEASSRLSIDGSSVSSEDLAAHRDWVHEIGLPKILGLDFLVDVENNVWLLEVNRFPGLEPRDSADAQVKK